MTPDEGIAYVMQELGISSGRARQMVLSIGSSQDERVSSIDLVLLNEHIKEMQVLTLGY